MRRIVHGVRDGKKTYKQGDEAALAKIATPAQIEQLLVKGAIVGDWSGVVFGKSVTGQNAPLAQSPDADGNVLTAPSDGVEKQGADAGEVVAEPETVSRETLPAIPPDPLAALHGLGIDILGTLIEAGYDTPEKIAAATDAELTALPKIGKATVAKIRAALN